MVSWIMTSVYKHLSMPIFMIYKTNIVERFILLTKDNINADKDVFHYYLFPSLKQKKRNQLCNT